MQSLLYINWSLDPDAFRIGEFAVRWYGVLFAMAFLSGYLLAERMFKKEGVPKDWAEKLLLFVLVGTFIGARLGHCLFYEPEYYLSHPLEILNFRQGGLASHGAAIGIILSSWLASRFITKRNVLWFLDRLVIFVALSGLFIRGGNLVNSEIVGSETTSSVGFVFQQPMAGDQAYPEFYAEYDGEEADIVFEPADLREMSGDLILYRGRMLGGEGEEVTRFNLNGVAGWKFKDSNLDGGKYVYSVYAASGNKPLNSMVVVARHPAQLYEAFGYLLIFFFLMWRYIRQRGAVPYGQSFGWFLVLTFAYRFFIEFFKEVQVSFESGMSLNMGQWLSIPFVLAGAFFIWFSMKKGEELRVKDLKREQANPPAAKK